MSDIAIRVENLSKQYCIGGPQVRYKTIRESLTQAARAPFRRLSAVVRGQSPVVSNETIWALKDVSFEVKRGEVVGVIGRNGAGKTTLLKVLSRITDPTEGRVRIRGRVGSLLEVGTGFHPELTGRENIVLNGAILGMKRAEIERNFDEIVAFAEIEKFVDTPVKRYSSGMQVRLAFSVAAHLEPEILLVDEVLAVGDAAFQKKCLGKMGDVAKGGRTVLFVSHNLAAVLNLCRRAIWLDSGRIAKDDETAQTVSSYMSSHQAADETQLSLREDRIGNGQLRIQELWLSNGSGAPIRSVESGAEVTFNLRYASQLGEALQNVNLGLHFYDLFGQKLFTAATRLVGQQFTNIRDKGVLSCQIPCLPLIAGTYTIKITAFVNNLLSDAIESAFHLEVIESDFLGGGVAMTRRKHGAILVQHYWKYSDS